jgi:hypothetical protein
MAKRSAPTHPELVRDSDTLYMRCHYCYNLYARNHCFLLKLEGEGECSEFATIFDAISYIEKLPQSDGSTLCIHNQLGHRIGQLLLNCGTLCGKPFQRSSPKRLWSRTLPDFRN